jgi:hypothetical protein
MVKVEGRESVSVKGESVSVKGERVFLFFGPPFYYYTPYLLPKKKKLRPQNFGGPDMQHCLHPLKTGPASKSNTSI